MSSIVLKERLKRLLLIAFLFSFLKTDIPLEERHVSGFFLISFSWDVRACVCVCGPFNIDFSSHAFNLESYLDSRKM